MEAAGDAAFVLVAGGLGERLGYSGIKLALPSDSARGACFLQVLPRNMTQGRMQTRMHVNADIKVAHGEFGLQSSNLHAFDRW